VRLGTRGRARDPELVEKAKRRTFTAAYKLQVVREAEIARLKRRAARAGRAGEGAQSD